MQYEVVLATRGAGRIAAVREPSRRLTRTTVRASARSGVAFVRDAGLATGHNVFVYDDTAPGVIQFGVQVDEEFADGDVVCAGNAGGTIATTTHAGPTPSSAAHHAVPGVVPR